MELATGETLDAGMTSLRSWWDIVEGEWVNEQSTEDKMVAMAGVTVAKRLGLKAGDLVLLKGSACDLTVKIVGIYDAGGSEDESFYLPVDTAQLLGDLEGKIDSIEVSALTTPDNELAIKAAKDPSSLTQAQYETWYCTAYVSSICTQIQEVITDCVASAVRQVADSEGTILDKTKLPLFYGGLSHCFRREAGAAGQFSKGLYRVHQFDKVEMFAYATPEQSDEIHAKLREIEEEIFEGLGLPFHVVDTCTGDLGAPAYRKWDLEAWMPGRNGGEYGEVTSTSNCTDYQARRLNIKYKDEDGKNKYVHTLNGTAIAVGRAMLAILENYQNADGSVTIPEVLVPYCGFDKILPKNK